MLTIKDLSVKFPSRFGDFTAIEDVDMTIKPGEIHGLVGESGAGKSTVGAAVIGLLSSPGYIANGELSLGNTNLRTLTPDQAHDIRGDRISMIFQDPQTSLNPLMTIEDQLIETIQAHSDVSYADALKRAVDLLEEIGIKDAARRIKAYPHQFSGGMRQRVVIALAICTDPELIIADEPTTALDVAVQSQVLDLIRRLAKDRQIAFMLITHDIGVIAQIADRVTVMRKGRVMETGETAQVLGAPEHPYTRALMDAVPPLDHRIKRFRVPDEDGKGPVTGNAAEKWLLEGQQHALTGLTLTDICMRFRGPRTSLWRKPEPFVALNDVSLEVRPGSILGLVGESGSGKSTLAKAITGLITPSSGIMKLGDDILPDGKARGRKHPSRQLIQMVFQDPYSSLNSRHRIRDILTEPLWFYGFVPDAREREKLAAAMLELVGMQPDAIDKYPHQFSGGQRQRIAVARALLARPRFLICDEPTSALDVSIQAEILNLLKDLQAMFGLTILFISHNLAVVRQMADDTAVLRNGRIEEIGSTDSVFERPSADYTQNLLALTPVLPKAWQSTAVAG
ncbi:ABC transporter ATP-binding protein [Yoonia sp. F2084L]|uniref:dipeptide ABC transporter ATP-binding protein n=1 Tax=Yoonia sp. F2084L TaxID=2926419 RepID=UPI001FF11495|nr:ABC transporter ATP-binding protein [Yoonia sp. F2084L]MCK0095593.1 ABC transporter ATP-binding protein [Yoonia sp. F2084L]